MRRPETDQAADADDEVERLFVRFREDIPLERLGPDGLAALVVLLDGLSPPERVATGWRAFRGLFEVARTRGRPLRPDHLPPTPIRERELDAALVEGYLSDLDVMYTDLIRTNPDCDLGAIVERCPDGYRGDLFARLLDVHEAYLGKGPDAINAVWRSVGRLAVTSEALRAEFCKRYDLPAEGSVVGEFVLDRVVAVGGMGVVYRARQRGAQRVCALKTVLPCLLQPPADPDVHFNRAAFDLRKDAVITRFRREVRVSERLEHPSLVYAEFSAVDDDRRPYYVMRYVSGGRTLLDLDPRRQPLPAAEVVRIAANVAKACQVINQLDYVHSDLTPPNVLLDAHNHPLLTDLGLCVSLDHGDREGAGAAGNPAYAAPEQLTSGAIGPATDVWGVGAVLHWLLTGRPVREGGVRVTVRGQDVVVHGCSADLKAVWMKCLRPDPHDRYHTLANLVDDLDRCAAGTPVRHARSAYFFRAAWRAGRSYVLVMATVLTAIAVTFVLASRAGSQMPRTEAIALACPSSVWDPRSDVRVERFRPAVPDYSGFEFDRTSRYWDLTLWKPVEKTRLKTESVQPAISTTVTTLRKREVGPRTNEYRIQYRTTGYEVHPRAHVLAAPPTDLSTRVVRYEYPEEMPGDRRGGVSVLVSTWELVLDLTEVGNDLLPFTVIDHAVWWNGLQDQTFNERSDWVAARFDYPIRAADLSVRLPPGKRLVDWSVCDFPRNTKQPFAAGHGKGTRVDYDTGLIFWQLPSPVPNQVYRLDWAWEDR